MGSKLDVNSIFSIFEYVERSEEFEIWLVKSGGVEGKHGGDDFSKVYFISILAQVYGSNGEFESRFDRILRLGRTDPTVHGVLR